MKFLKICMKNLSNFSFPRFKLIQRNIATKEKISRWKSTIGLEVHAQISVESKLFSAGSSEYALLTNSGVNLFDAAIPGTLPVLNKKAVELAVLAALTLKCKVNPVSLFDRKHYFYADLPNGYQITQQRLPLAENGLVEFAIFNPSVHKAPYYKTSKIKQIQLEQDSGKSYHEIGIKESFIDLNRAGIALIEIVFEPDLEDAEEAAALIKELCFILQAAGSCSCKMEEGALRVDANVSVHEEGKELGVRTEIKNIGSIRGVANAINHEISRQLDVIKNGGKVSNQTLTWDAVSNKTILLRDKEGNHDYRFMPEPNLPPLRIITDENSNNYHSDVKDDSCILDLRHLNNNIPQLPQEKRKLLLEKYEASDLIAYNLVNIPRLYTYFTDIMTEDPSRNIKSVYNTLLTVLLTALNNCKLDISECPLSSSHLGEIADMRGIVISEKMSKLILEKMLMGNKLSPKEIVAEEDLALLPEEKLREICLRVIEDNPKEVKKASNGKKRAMDLLVRNVLELAESKATLVKVETLLSEILEVKNKNKT